MVNDEAIEGPGMCVCEPTYALLHDLRSSFPFSVSSAEGKNTKLTLFPAIVLHIQDLK